MIITALRDYWTLVQAHRQGNEDVLDVLKLMAEDQDRSGRLAYNYLLSQGIAA